MILSSTLVKSFFLNGSKRAYCPYRIKNMLIDRKYDISSDAINKGNFFETLCIGHTRGGSMVTDLPRKRNGDKTIDQKRIERQAETFKELAKKYKIELVDENVQVLLKKKLANNIFLHGHPDIFPVHVKDPEIGDVIAVIDLKLAKSIRNTFGEYCWGDYERYDDIQAQCYMYLAEDLDLELNDHLNPDLFKYFSKGLDVRFYYWVFSYYEGRFQKEYVPLENKIIRAEKSPLKRLEMLESLRKTYSLMRKHEKEGWVKKECIECNKCPIPCEHNLNPQLEPF